MLAVARKNLLEAGGPNAATPRCLNLLCLNSTLRLSSWLWLPGALRGVSSVPQWKPKCPGVVSPLRLLQQSQRHSDWGNATKGRLNCTLASRTHCSHVGHRFCAVEHSGFCTCKGVVCNTLRTARHKTELSFSPRRPRRLRQKAQSAEFTNRMNVATFSPKAVTLDTTSDVNTYGSAVQHAPDATRASAKLCSSNCSLAKSCAASLSSLLKPGRR